MSSTVTQLTGKFLLPVIMSCNIANMAVIMSATLAGTADVRIQKEMKVQQTIKDDGM